MDKQRGGAFTVSGYIALALVALAILEAGMIRHLYSHRVMSITPNCPAADMDLPPLVIKGHPPDVWQDDAYKTHAFPEKSNVCTRFDTICWIRI